jgi:hypothetical protein
MGLGARRRGAMIPTMPGEEAEIGRYRPIRAPKLTFDKPAISAP